MMQRLAEDHVPQQSHVTDKIAFTPRAFIYVWPVVFCFMSHVPPSLHQRHGTG